MKRIFTLGMILCAAITVFGQSDTTGKNNAPDTIKVGGMLIIRKSGGNREIVRERRENDTAWHHPRHDKPSNVSTNWWIVDFGFSNYNDKTNYGSTAAQVFAPTSTDESFKLRTWKSRNIDLWFFMQRLNVAAHIVNLKYGVGLELNNYFFDDHSVNFHKDLTPERVTFDLPDVKKNKMAADYLTVPIMLNFNFTPHRNKETFGFSAGISGGYLYSSRQKIKDGGHIHKTHDDFDLSKWKVAYVGELLLGPVKLYGSYATKSMWEKGLDQTPYTVGVRLSNW